MERPASGSAASVLQFGVRFVTAVTTVVVAALALAGAATRHAERAVAQAAVAPAPSTLVAVDWASRPSQQTLVELDAVTLEPSAAPPVPVTGMTNWKLSPKGDEVAFGAQQRGPIRIVDLRSMTLVHEVRAGVGWSEVRAWPRADRLLAVSSVEPATFVVVDPAAGRVVRRVRLTAHLVATAPSAGGLVALVAPVGRIGASRLVAVAATGAVRTVALRRISAGLFWRNRAQNPVGRISQPGLVVDIAAGKAYVVSADDLVAAVDLATLRVSYHRPHPPRSFLRRLLDWLEPSAAAKALNGQTRTAAWLGGGKIAEWGWNESWSLKKNGVVTGRETVSGLKLIDTRSWTIRTLDKRSVLVGDAADSFVAINARKNPTPPAWTLTGYTRAGDELFRKPIARTANVYRVGPYAYLWNSPKHVTVLDASTGAVLGERDRDLLTPVATLP